MLYLCPCLLSQAQHTFISLTNNFLATSRKKSDVAIYLSSPYSPSSSLSFVNHCVFVLVPICVLVFTLQVAVRAFDPDAPPSKPPRTRRKTMVPSGGGSTANPAVEQ